MLVQVNDVKTVGALVRKVRKAQELDQLTAAAVADCGITFVSQFENGKPTVHLEKVLAMLDALGIKVYLDAPLEASEDNSDES